MAWTWRRQPKVSLPAIPLPMNCGKKSLLNRTLGATAVNQVYVYGISLMMRRGPQKLAVGVRDEVGATQSFTVRTMNIGSKG